MLDVKDIVRRRFRFHLKNDPVDAIYLDIVDEVKQLTFILSVDLSQEDKAVLETKYSRLLTEFDMIRLQVLNKTNHWHRKPNTECIYYKRGGFV